MNQYPYRVPFSYHVGWAMHMSKLQWCKNRNLAHTDYDITDVGSAKGEVWHFKNEDDAVAFRLRFGK